MGYPQNEPSIIREDNMATILMATRGYGKFKNTKHIGIKYFLAQQHIAEKSISVIHCATDVMAADQLTKPVQGKTFIINKNLILNIPHTTLLNDDKKSPFK